jgi:hypothetical protein
VQQNNLVVFGVVCRVTPKPSILGIGGSLKNGQDDVESAKKADFEKSSADLTAMHRDAMCVTCIHIGRAPAQLFLQEVKVVIRN